MKKIYDYIFAIVLAGMMVSPSAGAQTEDIEYGTDPNAINLEKKVVKTKSGEGEGHNEYLITLEAFVPGQKTVTEVHKPIDFSIILDVSGSMGYELTADKEYYLNRVGSIAYAQTGIKDIDKYGVTTSYSKCDWKDGHPYYYSLSGTSQRSEFVFKDGETYRKIFRGETGVNDYFDSNNYFIYIETDNSINDPVTGKSIKQRRFLGKDSNGNSVISEPAPASLPLIYDDGKLVPATGFFAASDSTPIYEGDLYTKSRMDALKNAVKSFIDIIAADDKTLGEGQHHNIGIIKFSNDIKYEEGNYLKDNSSNHNNYSQPLAVLQSIENSGTIKDKIDGLTASGITRTDYGMQLAKTMYEGTDASRTKIAVLFTDGEPTSNNDFDYSVANGALKEADLLKRQGVKVYVIGLTSTALSTRFMSYASSDYAAPEGTGTFTEMKQNSSEDIHGHQDYFNKYFNLVQNGEELNKIFKDIAEQSAKTKIAYKLSEENSVVLDALSKNFKFPDGIDATHHGDIHAYTSKLFDDGSFAQKGGEGWTDITSQVTVGVTTSSKKNEVTVSGFDFDSNWVGYEEHITPTETTKTAHGCKLVIEIPIVVDPRNPGGASVFTNEAYSGLYEKDKISTKKPLKPFPQPAVTMPNIIIEKTGMNQGDCAMFKIERVNENGEPISGYKAYTIMAIANNEGKAQTQIKLNTEGRYRITEQDWSWAYTPSAEATSAYGKDDEKTVNGSADGLVYIIRNINSDTEESVKALESGQNIKGTLFKFKNTEKEGTPMHDEASTKNVFGKFEYEAPENSDKGQN